MSQDAEAAGKIVESLPNRPLEFQEVYLLHESAGDEYLPMSLLHLTTDDGDERVGALHFTVLESFTTHLLGYSAVKQSWEVIGSFEVGGEDWQQRQKQAVDEWADEALASFDGEREYIAPTDVEELLL